MTIKNQVICLLFCVKNKKMTKIFEFTRKIDLQSRTSTIFTFNFSAFNVSVVNVALKKYVPRITINIQHSFKNYDKFSGRH